jgi:hypothetical protein
MDLEKELKKWREKRAQQPNAANRPGPPAATTPDRRTVRVNGQEVVVVKKGKRTAS